MAATLSPKGAQPIKGTFPNGEAFEFIPTGDVEADLGRAVELEHGDCSCGYCDIDAALRSGFPLCAAHLFMGATETPLTDAVARFYGGIPQAKGKHKGWPRGWARWTAWFRCNTVECPKCGAFNFTDEGEPSACANCLANLRGGRP